MSIKLSDLTKATKTIPVQLGEDTLTVTFKTGFYTTEAASRLRGADDPLRAQAELVASTIVSWDFVEDGPKGKVVPVTVETVIALPLDVVGLIFTAMFEAVHPNPTKADSSAGG